MDLDRYCNTSVLFFSSVPEPKLDAFVICRTRKFLGAFPVDDRQLIYFSLV
ncbi:hypothetical protein Hanom_Chr10g00907361 [Helianthus anomalus]